MLMVVLAAGALGLGMINPAFLTVGILLKAFQKEEYKNQKKFQNTFHYLKRRGFLTVESRKGEAHISLTKEGRKRAEWYKFAGAIQKRQKQGKKDPKGKKYLILFDVPSEDRTKRNAFRHLLKRLGCVQLQKSVWLSFYDCREDVKFLKTFVEMSTKVCRVVTVEDLGGPLS